MHILRPYLKSLGNLDSGQMTERDAAMLVIAAGRKAGFTVRTEVSVVGHRPSGKSGRGEIDVGWYAPMHGRGPQDDRLVVAWEIDGRDASDGHFTGRLDKDTLGNSAKFNAACAARKIQILYSLSNNLKPKRRFNENIFKLLPVDVVIYTDEQLMAPNGIELLQNELRRML
jgi:hypothetical protein